MIGSESAHGRRILSAALAAILCLAWAGCESQPERRPPAPPRDLQPRLVTLALYSTFDEDQNGYPDTLPVAFYLWDDRYPLPFWHEGAIAFSLKNEQEEVLAEWAVPTEIVMSARRRDQVGAVHVLSLDIRDATTDVLPQTAARLSAVFVGDDGQTASTMRPLVVRLGR